MLRVFPGVGVENPWFRVRFFPVGSGLVECDLGRVETQPPNDAWLLEIEGFFAFQLPVVVVGLTSDFQYPRFDRSPDGDSQYWDVDDDSSGRA